MKISVLQGAAYGFQLSGYLAAETRLFSDPPLNNEQHRNNTSIAILPEFYHNWDKQNQSLIISPFLRIDQNDTKRTHFDLRELYWQKVSRNWELRIGMQRVFWGVIELYNIVDIINQTDLVENLDFKARLGQFAVNYVNINKIGTFDLFILPGFRERTFPGVNGRFQNQLRIAGEASAYESKAADRHVDIAIRWSISAGAFDIGMHHFYGNSREPNFSPGIDKSNNPVLIPSYDLINQSGIDLQYIHNELLWKIESIYRKGKIDSYYAVSTGIEYTYSNIFISGSDIVFIGEYLFDERIEDAPIIFEDDFFIAAKVSLNDIQSTELSIGLVIDRNSKSRMFVSKFARRIRESWKIDFEYRGFYRIASDDILYGMRRDSYLQLEIFKYF
ncbi:hypothetical protein ACFL6O_03235 [candidate division KSB1 bacterium]